MKKLIAVVSAIFVGASSLFALGNTIDVNFDIPMLAQSLTTSGSSSLINSSYTTTVNSLDLGFGFDVADTLKLTKSLGVKADAGFWWPSSTQVSSNTTTKIGNSTSTSSTGPNTTNYSDVYSSYFDFNLFLGVAYSPIARKNGLTVTVTPGVDLNWASAKAKNSDNTNSAFHFGVGADLSVSFAVAKKFYITAGCPLVFFFTETVNDKANDNYKGAFSFTPKVGVGYRF